MNELSKVTIKRWKSRLHYFSNKFGRNDGKDQGEKEETPAEDNVPLLVASSSSTEQLITSTNSDGARTMDSIMALTSTVSLRIMKNAD